MKRNNEKSLNDNIVGGLTLIIIAVAWMMFQGWLSWLPE